MIAHQICLRYPDPMTSDTVLNGTFERTEGGWLELKSDGSKEFIPDCATMKARNLRFDDPVKCPECGELAANKQGLSAHMRYKHGKGKVA